MGTLVTKADTVAAKGMLDHAFRNAGPRALRDVAFGDIALAFAHHRHAETAELAQACSDLLGPLMVASKAMQADGRVLDDNAQAAFDRALTAIARATGAGA